jgi:uncharacterized tellurite resistance protein B-like protein
MTFRPFYREQHKLKHLLLQDFVQSGKKIHLLLPATQDASSQTADFPTCPVQNKRRHASRIGLL